MDSVQDLLGRSYMDGWDNDDDETIEDFECSMREYVVQNEDRIRRAVLIEEIRALELEWKDGKHVHEAHGLGSDFYCVDGNRWVLYSSDGYYRFKGAGGKAGAIADYRRRWAAPLESRYPGITDEALGVCGE